MRSLLLCACLLLPGCAVLESPDTFAVCKAADVTTTYVALQSGFVEKNPFVRGLLTHGWLPFIAVSVLAWFIIDRINEPTLTVPANVATCAVAAHNALLLL